MKIEFDDIDTLLIWIYLFIDNLFTQTELSLFTMRLSNNNCPHFTDTELFTCAIFTELIGFNTKKDGYLSIQRHYLSWFPKLPSYEVYNRKLNKYHEALAYIFQMLRNKYASPNQSIAQIDAAPISVCQAQHSATAAAAKPFVTKGNVLPRNNFILESNYKLLLNIE